MNWEQEYLCVKEMSSPSAQRDRIEELIDRAEIEQNLVWLYKFAIFRSSLLYANGNYHEFLGSFEWCLEFFECNPSLFDDEQTVTVLQQYQWALELYPQFPETPKDVIEESLEDYRARLYQYGFSLRSYHLLSYKTYRMLHEYEDAETHYLLWKSAERDERLDCQLHEWHEEAMYELEKGNVEQAFSLFWKMEEIDDQQSVLSSAYALALLPLCRLYPEGAKKFHEKGCFRAFQHPKFLGLQALHILYLLSVDKRKAERLWSLAYESASLGESEYDQMVFFLSTWCLFAFVPHLADLHDFDMDQLLHMIKESADAFDVRNENDGCFVWMNYIFSYMESIFQSDGQPS